MPNRLVTSESVSMGHPDKVADQISDAILDEYLRNDPESRVACETLVTTGLVVVAGEITSKAKINIPDVVRETIKEIGYDKPGLGFDANECAIMVTVDGQSPDIAQGVNAEGADGKIGSEQGAGDQGMMYGYACNETEDLMPLPITLANKILFHLSEAKQSYLRPDAKSQVTVEYDENDKPVRVDTVVLSTQHDENVSRETLVADMLNIIKEAVPGNLIDDKTRFLINPTGKFVIGGPHGDCGLTGRKIIVDTYGGMGRHGGGAFSGKDPSKVDRSAAYAARYVAKNIVAAGYADKCEVQISYAIGYSKPVSIYVDTFGTGKVDDSILAKAVQAVFDLSPAGIIKMLDLKKPIYRWTAFGGHFGKSNNSGPRSWEKTDKVEELKTVVDEILTRE